MNWKRFNEELRERMNIPDETDEEFLARMTEARQNAKRYLSNKVYAGTFLC